MKGTRIPVQDSTGFSRSEQLAASPKFNRRLCHVQACMSQVKRGRKSSRVCQHQFEFNQFLLSLPTSSGKCSDHLIQKQRCLAWMTRHRLLDRWAARRRWQQWLCHEVLGLDFDQSPGRIRSNLNHDIIAAAVCIERIDNPTETVKHRLVCKALQNNRGSWHEVRRWWCLQWH